MIPTGSSTLEFATLDGGSRTVSAESIAQFRGAFRGPLLSGADAGYDDTRQIWNGMIDRRPALIARCTGVADVVQAVTFARDHDLLISVRGGGHNIAGLAVCDRGLMIDLSLMKGIFVDHQTHVVRAQAGCTLGDVDRETQLHGQATPLGFVSLTGIAGLTTGGGFGYLTRRFGWTSDNVISMDVVTASGDVVRASETENHELFWCLRGGSGNFGIVTSFEYRTFAVGPMVFGGLIAWPAADAHNVLNLFREMSAAAPRKLTLVAMLRLAPPAPWVPPAMHGKPIVGVIVCYSGPPEEGEQLVAPLRALGKPVADILMPRPYTQMQSLIDATQPKGRRYYWKSEYLPEIDPKLFDVLIEHLGTVPSPHSAIALFQIDGALNELPASHSPVGNRDARFVLNIPGSWESAANDRDNIAWVRSCWQGSRQFSTGGVYVNFLTDDEGADRVTAAYGQDTFDTLAALKRKYDPQGLFRHTKNFGPSR